MTIAVDLGRKATKQKQKSNLKWLCMYWNIGWAFIFIAWYPDFRLYILYLVKFEINIFTGYSLCQDTISTYKLSIYVKNM